jgi:hypothetical protein
MRWEVLDALFKKSDRSKPAEAQAQRLSKGLLAVLGQIDLPPSFAQRIIRHQNFLNS